MVFDSGACIVMQNVSWHCVPTLAFRCVLGTSRVASTSVPTGFHRRPSLAVDVPSAGFLGNIYHSEDTHSRPVRCPVDDTGEPLCVSLPADSSPWLSLAKIKEEKERSSCSPTSRRTSRGFHSCATRFPGGISSTHGKWRVVHPTPGLLPLQAWLLTAEPSLRKAFFLQ